MPQIFEFHFNPKAKEDLIFDSFCFEPKNIYEKRMGGLYMVGLLKNVLPQNIRFLDVLTQKIKEKYYKTVSSAPEKSLRDTLRIANEHLEKIAKQGDVSWLGNLSFAVISLKDFELNFTKVGDLKIFLIRKGQIIDIDQKLKFDDIEPYPLKIFGNIVSGKLAENDIILVLSKEVYDAFLKENLLNEIARKSLSDLLPEGIKKFKDVLNDKKEQLTKISGICLLMVLSKEAAPKEKETLSGKKVLKIFSFKEVFNPLVKIIKNFQIPKIQLPSFYLWKRGLRRELSSLLNKLKTRAQNKVLCSVEHIKKLCALISYKFPDKLKRKVILVLALILLLVIGFFIFEKREEEKIKTYQIQINQIQEKISQAESYLILAEYNPQAKKNANRLYKEVWDEISPLVNVSSNLPSIVATQLLDLKKAVSENLEQLNKLVKISEPEPIFEFKAKEFIPQKLISFKDKIYFFTPYSENIFELNQEGKGEIMEINKKFSLAVPLSSSIIFFSKPNQIVNFQDGKFSEPVSLENPYPEGKFDFMSLVSYRSHLYFLDAENNSIIKYPLVSELNSRAPAKEEEESLLSSPWGTPEPWLAPEIKTALDFKSMAVDGSIWILTNKNAVERYYTGRLQQTISLEIFPYPENFSKIFTTFQHPYLYILEQGQKRVIISDKSGRIIKQYQSEKFDNLLDFAVSEDDKTIWLLNGLKVYKISSQRE